MIRVRAGADVALFERPEMTIDTCSYDMITPAAARGLLESIYWHPGIRWVVDKIYVLSPIKFIDLGTGAPGAKVVMALTDVDYIIEAHFDMTKDAAPTDNAGKFMDITRRRLEKGNFYKQPYLGSKEYPATVSTCPGKGICTAYQGTKDLGYMLYDFDYSSPVPTARYFRAALKDGVLDLRKPPKLLRGPKIC